MNERSRKEDLLIAEYSEIGNCYRHDDTVAFNMGSFLLPVALGAVAVAAGQPKLRLVIGLGSLLVCAYWLAVVARVSWYTSLRLARAAQIEEILGFDHHLSIRRQPAAGKPLPNDVWQQTKRFERWIFWLGYSVPARRVHFLLLVGLLIVWGLVLFIPVDEQTVPSHEKVQSTTIYGGVNRN